MHKLKKVILLTSSGYNNIGQEAIVHEIILQTKRKYHSIKIICTSYNPEISNKIHKIKNVFFIKIFSLNFIYEFLVTKKIIIAGDELNSESLDILYPKFYQYFQGKQKLFIPFFSLILLKEIEFYSIGVYSFQKHYPFKILSFVLNKSKNISVRDTLSKEKIKKFTTNKIKIIDDLGYYVKFKQKKKEKILGVILKDPLNKSLENKIIRFLNKQDKKIIFFIFSAHPYLILENDLIFLNRIKKFIKIPYEIYNYNSPYKMKTELSKVDSIISMRFHGCVFASSLKIPFKVILISKKMNVFKKNKLLF